MHDVISLLCGSFSMVEGWEWPWVPNRVNYSFYLWQTNGRPTEKRRSHLLFLVSAGISGSFWVPTQAGQFRVAASECVCPVHMELWLWQGWWQWWGLLVPGSLQLQCEPGLSVYYKTAVFPVSAASVAQWSWVLHNIIFSFLSLVLGDGVFQLLVSFGFCSSYHTLADNLLD